MNKFESGLTLIEFQKKQIIAYLVNEQIISNGLFYPIIRINLPIKNNNEYLSTILPDKEINVIKTIKKTADFYKDHLAELKILDENGWDFNLKNNLETINLLYFLEKNKDFETALENLHITMSSLEEHYLADLNRILKESGLI